MNGNQHLTFLQHGVIRRLEAAGFQGLAQRARRHWSRGEPLGDIRFDEEYGVRARELLRANEQAERIGRELSA
jgi:hypothetical protein